MKTKSARVLGLAILVPAALGLVAGAAASCSQTPANVAVRSFQQAQKVDVVCIHVNEPNGDPLPADEIQPLSQDHCSLVPDTIDGGSSQPNHLYAVVTQLTTGELAVVDLTAGDVVDEDPATPGVNFIPVGPVPTDVKTQPDGLYTFVSSGDPSKPAIYAINNKRLLGTSQGTPPPAPLTLTDLSACALPQPPQALVVEPMIPQAGAEAGDGGTEGGTAEGGAAGGGFVLVAMLREFAGEAPKVAAIDISTLVNGSPGALPACHILGYTNLSGAPAQTWTPGPTWPDGVPYVDGGVDLDGQSPSLGPSCNAAPGEAGVAAGAANPLVVTPGAQPAPLYMALRDDLPIVYVADSMLPLIHVVDLTDPTAPKELEPLLATSVVNPQRPITVGQLAVSPVTSEFTRYLYAVDYGEGSLMVYDVTNPATSPRTPMLRPHAELNPLAEPDRIAFPAPVATVAFVEHDWFLANQNQGTNPVNQYSGILCNPNPNAHPDAGVFLQNGAYYRVDQASLIQINGTQEYFPGRLRGVFGFVTLSNGSIVTINVDDWDAPCRRPDPMAITTVSEQFTNTKYSPAPGGSGLPSVFGQTGVLDIPQPLPSSLMDFDPYHAPLTYNSIISESTAVTQEAFFPVSAPNRLRSSALLMNDPQSGDHAPYVQSAPQLFNLTGSSVPSGASSPLILPTVLPPGGYDPNFVNNPTEPDPAGRNASSPLASFFLETNQDLIPGGPALSTTATDGGSGVATTLAGPEVRISHDDPTASVNQEWTVTYEGALSSVSGISGAFSSDDGYQTMTLTAASPQLCERGIEDYRIGQARATEVLAALQAAGLPKANVTPPTAVGLPPPTDFSLLNWTTDYVQITDDLLPPYDPYWGVPATANTCWDGPLADDATNPNIAQTRYNQCNDAFGTSYDTNGPNGFTFGDQNFDVNTVFARDFPILQAFDDHLVLGRFYWPQSYVAGSNSVAVPESNTNRIIVGPDPNNATALRFAQCCFHSQTTSFSVRTGGEWVANGNTLGFLHHVQTDPTTGSCVLSCDPRLALVNARSFDIPWSMYPSNTVTSESCPAPSSSVQPPSRDSVLAMRNPMFSYVTWSGCGAPATPVDHTTTVRDDQWKFSVQGGFTPLLVSLTQGTNTPVSPQSMLFIPSIQQLAVVDGELQGLVLIDLNTLAFAHAPYF